MGSKQKKQNAGSKGSNTSKGTGSRKAASPKPTATANTPVAEQASGEVTLPASDNPNTATTTNAGAEGIMAGTLTLKKVSKNGKGALYSIPGVLGVVRFSTSIFAGGVAPATIDCPGVEFSTPAVRKSKLTPEEQAKRDATKAERAAKAQERADKAMERARKATERAEKLASRAAKAAGKPAVAADAPAAEQATGDSPVDLGDVTE